MMASQIFCGQNTNKFLSPGKFHAHLQNDGWIQDRNDLALQEGATCSGSYVSLIFKVASPAAADSIEC
jgi:hypothetical protein